MTLSFLAWLLFLAISSSVSTASDKIPRLSPFGTGADQQKHASLSDFVSEDYKLFFYNQTLDHFNYNLKSYGTFQQRYVINSKYWGGGGANASAPIFAYLGAESPLVENLEFIGFLPENAPRFKALLVYIEHRYYGESIPFGSMEEALNNESTRGYFNSAQALADYAEVLTHIKQNLSAQNSPIIVIGGSYGGMLASWFRLKYPHIAHGALASSAPLLYFDDITSQDGYFSTVSKDFREVSESCHDTIRESWDEIDRVASEPNGLSILSQRFKTCTQLRDSFELKDYLETMYAGAAQYNRPPIYPVTVVCGGIDGAPNGTDTLGRIYAGLAANRQNRSCYKTVSEPDESDKGWQWQTCSEMVMTIGKSSNVTMFQPLPFVLDDFIRKCERLFGVAPRPNWVTTYYGGHDIKKVLKKFGSNIIFSNGLQDPYSTGGVLEDISDSLLAVVTINGSHCLDTKPADESDPEWLIEQRNIEINIIQEWINEYYADLHTFKK